MNSGYVYVLGNASLGNLLKIGRTERDPDARAVELSRATEVPTPFYVIYKRFFDDCIRAEACVHAQLGEHGYRTSDQREFFEVEIDKAIDALRSASDMLEQSKDGFSLESATGTAPDEALLTDEHLSVAFQDENDGDDMNFQLALDESAYAWIQLLEFYKTLSTYDEFAEIYDLPALDAIVERFGTEFQSLGDVARGILDDYPNTDDLMEVLRAVASFYIELDKDDGELNVQTERMLQEINAWYQDSEKESSELPGSLPDLHLALAGFYSWCRLLAFHYRHAQLATYRASEFAKLTVERLDLDICDEENWLGISQTHLTGLQEFTLRLDSLFDDLRAAVKRELAFDFCDFGERIEHFRPLFRSYRSRREAFRQSISDLYERTFGNDETRVAAAPYDEILNRAIAHMDGDEETGVLSDPAEARRLFKSASKMGSARAEWELGHMILRTESSDQVEQATSHFKDCARKGWAGAHLELAVLFADRDERNAKISISNYLRSVDLHSDMESWERDIAVLYYLRGVTRRMWPVPEGLVSAFAHMRCSLMREFAVDLRGLGLGDIGWSALRSDDEEEIIDRVEDCLDQMDRT